MTDIDALFCAKLGLSGCCPLSSSRSGVNGCGPRRASSSTNAIAARVRLDTRRGRSSKRVSDRVGSSERVPRAAADKPRRYSPLVGVGDDEDGEESEGVDKMAAVAESGQIGSVEK